MLKSFPRSNMYLCRFPLTVWPSIQTIPFSVIIIDFLYKCLSFPVVLKPVKTRIEFDSNAYFIIGIYQQCFLLSWGDQKIVLNTNWGADIVICIAVGSNKINIYVYKLTNFNLARQKTTNSMKLNVKQTLYDISAP